MRSAWVSFAARGEPGWPPYDADQRLTQRFDAASGTVAEPEEASRRIWQGDAFAALPLLDQ